MPQATVHLLRHGEVHNPDGVLYGRLPEFHLSELGREMAETLAAHFTRARGAGRPRSPISRHRRWSGPRRRPYPRAEALHLEIHTDERIIEAENYFQGLKVTKAELRKPKHWPHRAYPLRPSWGEPYKAQAARVRTAVEHARLPGHRTCRRRLWTGPEAIMVSHQLPIWATRLSAEGRPLWHDPRKRECTLTSITSLVLDDDGSLLRVEYSEPAAALFPVPPPPREPDVAPTPPPLPPRRPRRGRRSPSPP